MRFNIVYSPESEENLAKLPKGFQFLIRAAITERLEIEPLKYGKPLRYSLKGFRTLRVSKYRIIYEVIQKENQVYIVKIAIRRDVYE